MSASVLVIQTSSVQRGGAGGGSNLSSLEL